MQILVQCMHVQQCVVLRFCSLIVGLLRCLQCILSNYVHLAVYFDVHCGDPCRVLDQRNAPAEVFDLACGRLNGCKSILMCSYWVYFPFCQWSWF